jgi:hypothetical protein
MATAVQCAIRQVGERQPLDNQGPVCEPWLYGVVSLLDMLQFYGDFFAEKMLQFSGAEVRLLSEKRENAVKPEVAVGLYAQIGVFEGLCVLHCLSSPASQCRRMMENLESKHMVVTCGDLRDDLRELRRRCEDEFKAAFFLHLDPRQAAMFQNPEKDWEQIIGRFYKVKYNVEECGKCFALERHGAAVFHVLQVAEFGVIQIAKLLGVEGDKPGWGSLKRLQELIKDPFPKRIPLAQKHSKLLEDVVPLAIVVKDSWRHKLDHVDNQIVWVDTDFSPNVAEEIISATRAFMRKLASELPQPRRGVIRE